MKTATYVNDPADWKIARRRGRKVRYQNQVTGAMGPWEPLGVTRMDEGVTTFEDGSITDHRTDPPTWWFDKTTEEVLAMTPVTPESIMADHGVVVEVDDEHPDLAEDPIVAEIEESVGQELDRRDRIGAMTVPELWEVIERVTGGKVPDVPVDVPKRKARKQVLVEWVLVNVRDRDL